MGTRPQPDLTRTPAEPDVSRPGTGGVTGHGTQATATYTGPLPPRLPRR